ncbi:MAG: PKD domain-containing protein [Candidatus Saccharibacteria bacterium]|nr:PKD domain-containing protein [Candidatus Saccharibacteria bacterium]
MKSLFSRLPMKLIVSVLVIVAFAGFFTAGSSALIGGDRQVKQYEGSGTPGFDHVQFNSFTDVPNIGDERDFFTGKVNDAPDGFYDPMNGVRGGDELLVRVYVHNNADKKHNESGQGVAKNTRVRVELPEGLSENQTARAFVSADNAQPEVIEDTLSLTGEYPVELDYVEGSANVKSNFQDRALSDDIVDSGVLIGDDNVNGDMKGCFEYVALVTFKVKVVSPSYELDKYVRIHDKEDFGEIVHVAPGDKVDFGMAFKNVGTTDLRDVIVGDRLPDGLSYVPDSTHVISGHTDNKWVKTSGDNIVSGGLTIGGYLPQGSAFVRFTAEVDEDEVECGTSDLVNIGYAKPKDHGTIEDKATVRVTKQCEEEPEKPVYKCEMITVKKLSDRKVRVDVDAPASNGATVKQYRYDFGDGSDELVTTDDSREYTYEGNGPYDIRVTVDFTVDGETKSHTSEACTDRVSFEKPEKPDQPEELPSTGAGSVVGLFTATTLAGTAVHRFVLSRRD